MVHLATYEPRCGTVYTQPSERNRATARRTVSRATPYSWINLCSDGIGRSTAHSPASIRARIYAATCRYTGTGES